jgi:SNF family Na+-dependent transporter
MFFFVALFSAAFTSLIAMVEYGTKVVRISAFPG